MRELGTQPVVEGLGHGMGVHRTSLKNRGSRGEGHGGIVGDLAMFQFEPATATNGVMRPVVSLDFVRRHEFHGRTQSIADGETQVGADTSCFHIQLFQDAFKICGPSCLPTLVFRTKTFLIVHAHLARR